MEREMEMGRDAAVWAKEGKHHRGGSCGRGGEGACLPPTHVSQDNSSSIFAPRHRIGTQREGRNGTQPATHKFPLPLLCLPVPLSHLLLALSNPLGEAQFVNHESPARPQSPSCLTPKHRRSTSTPSWSELGASVKPIDYYEQSSGPPVVSTASKQGETRRWQLARHS